MIKLKRQRKAPVDLQVKRMSLTKEKKIKFKSDF